MAHRTKRWKRLLKLLCFAVLISSVNVFIHLQFAQTSKADIEQFNGHVLGQMTSAESLAMVYRQKRSDPVLSIRKRGTRSLRIGAQMSMTQSLLNGPSPRLVWSHQGPADYLDGLNHVTHYFEGHTFDCLETITDGRYLVTLQLTVRYTVTDPSSALTGYITLTIFGTDLVSIVAKTSFNIPGPEKRKALTVKQPVAMVRSVAMHTGDKLCVTVSNPELIYVSNIDNFLTFVYL